MASTVSCCSHACDDRYNYNDEQKLVVINLQLHCSKKSRYIFSMKGHVLGCI